MFFCNLFERGEYIVCMKYCISCGGSSDRLGRFVGGQCRGCYELCPISYSVGDIYKRCVCGASSRQERFIGGRCQACHYKRLEEAKSKRLAEVKSGSMDRTCPKCKVSRVKLGQGLCSFCRNFKRASLCSVCGSRCYRGSDKCFKCREKDIVCKMCGGFDMESHPFIIRSDGVKLHRHAACVKPKKIKERVKKEYVMPVEKECNKCGEVKGLGEFYVSRGKPYGACKKCHGERNKMNKSLNLDRYREYHRKYHRKYWSDYIKGIRRRK
jgi:hypothetical protein